MRRGDNELVLAAVLKMMQITTCNQFLTHAMSARVHILVPSETDLDSCNATVKDLRKLYYFHGWNNGVESPCLLHWWRKKKKRDKRR